MTIRRHLFRAGISAVLVIVFFIGFTGLRLWVVWRDVPRVVFDPAEARAAMASTSTGAASAEGGDPSGGQESETGTTLADDSPNTLPEATDEDEAILALVEERYTSFLIVGNAEKDVPRADSILLFLMPEGDDPPVLASLPRDLYLSNPCSGRHAALTTALEGCGSVASGPETLALMVEDFVGFGIDHFAVIDFEGFTEVVDRLGGVEICLEHAVRVNPAGDVGDMLIPAGCSGVESESLLVWLRSRTTQELVDGEWRAVEGETGATRSLRTRTFLLSLFSELKAFRSVSDLAGLAEDLGSAVTLDDGLSLGSAVDLAWELRSVPAAAFRQPVITGAPAVSAEGFRVVAATTTFSQALVAVGFTAVGAK